MRCVRAVCTVRVCAGVAAVVSVLLVARADGRQTGEGYAELEDAAAVERAVAALNRRALKGRSVELFAVTKV